MPFYYKRLFLFKWGLDENEARHYARKLSWDSYRKQHGNEPPPGWRIMDDGPPPFKPWYNTSTQEPQVKPGSSESQTSAQSQASMEPLLRPRATQTGGSSPVAGVNSPQTAVQGRQDPSKGPPKPADPPASKFTTEPLSKHAHEKALYDRMEGDEEGMDNEKPCSPCAKRNLRCRVLKKKGESDRCSQCALKHRSALDCNLLVGDARKTAELDWERRAAKRKRKLDEVGLAGRGQEVDAAGPKAAAPYDTGPWEQTGYAMS